MIERIYCKNVQDRLEFIWQDNPTFPHWAYNKVIREYYRFWEGADTDEKFGVIFSGYEREPIETITRAFRKMTNREGTYGEKETLQGYVNKKFIKRYKRKNDRNK